MNRPSLLLGLLLMAPLAAVAADSGWIGGMEDGSVVRIDPESNQATRFSGEGAVQLWDGVHRMQDGSTVTVKDGVVTSRSGGQADTPVFAPAPSDPGLAPSACVALEIKVCGFYGECRESPACSPARQLMELERSEAWQNRGESANQTTAQCMEALQNDAFFAPCDTGADAASPTPCDRLVSRLCGDEPACAETRACQEALQFQKMEQRERSRNRRPKELTPASRQCDEELATLPAAGVCGD